MSILFKRFKDWATSITSFRTGDVIPVDGPSGTAKMPYSDLAKEVIKDSANNPAATEADLVAASKMPIITANGLKALPGNTITSKTYAENVAASIAPPFDPTRNYVVGDSCTYGGTAYIFTSNHPAGAWNPAHATISGQNALLQLTSQNALAENVAPAFIPNDTNAVVGMPYVYGGKFYVAKEDYSGEWNASKFKLDNIGTRVYADASLHPTESSSSNFLGYDKVSGKTELFDGGLIAKSSDLYGLDNDVRGVPFVLDRGTSKAGQIVDGHWFYLDTPSNKHFIVDVSRLRGKHITDTSGETHKYTFLTYYDTPVNNQKVLFCNGVTLSSGVINGVQVPADANYMYIDHFFGNVAPTLRCYDYSLGLAGETLNLSNSLYGKKIDLSYTTKSASKISNDVDVGDTIAFSSSSYRHVGVLTLPTNKGMLCISKVLHASTYVDVALCDKDDVVVGGKIYSTNSSYPYSIYINLSDYPNAKSVYFNYSTNAADTPSVSIQYESIENKTFYKKGVILLHFDGVEIDLNGTIVSTRKSLLEEYGIKKASACLDKKLFGDGTDNTFSSWRNQDLEAEYWSCVKDGWDFALYPSMYALEKDESEWNDFMDVAFGNLANLNIHNITTWACGRLDVTHDLLNACIKHNIKVVRGGSPGDSISHGDYVYSDANIYMPTSETYETTLVNKTFFYGANTDIETIKPLIRRAAETRTAISIFTHQVKDTVSDPTVDCTTANFRLLLAFIKQMVDAGEIEVMSWREYYASASARDGYENDYNRLLKMSL